MNKAIFLDRDGTINEEYEDGGLDDINKAKLLPNSLKAFEKLASLDYLIFIIANQVCIYEGRITPIEFEAINNKIISFLNPYDKIITKTYVCPHASNSTCECHKPKPGMLLEAAKDFDLNLSESYMIGDRLTDIKTGLSAGTKTIFVKTGTGLGWLPEVSPDYTVEDLLGAIELIEK